MKAMVLAAGLGTRLRPLTDDRPKALVEVGGRTMLEITLARLRDFGVHDVIVNVHHFAQLVVDYLRQKNNFGMRIEVSVEDELLDTGGGLKKAEHFFLRDSNLATGLGPGKRDEPFLVHNVDVLSSIDLEEMIKFHSANQALATLAVRQRQSSRLLLFDRNGLLCGRSPDGKPTPESNSGESLAFSGIHVISPRLLPMLTEDGAFSIIDAYLRLAASGDRILAYRDDRSYWRDLGKPESVAQGAEDAQQFRSSKES